MNYEAFYKLAKEADFNEIMEAAKTVEPMMLVQIERVNSLIKNRFIENNRIHKFMRENPNESEFYKKVEWEQTRGIQKSWKNKIMNCEMLDQQLYSLLTEWLDMRDQYNEVVKGWKANKFVRQTKESGPKAPQFGNLEKECVEIIKQMGEDFKKDAVDKTTKRYELEVKQFQSIKGERLANIKKDHKTGDYRLMMGLMSARLLKEYRYDQKYELKSDAEVKEIIASIADQTGDLAKSEFFGRIIPKLTCLNLAGKTKSWSYEGRNYEYTITVELTDGRILTVLARITYNVSPLGNHFNQFPITFYLNRKFLSEFQIKQLFK